MRFRILALAIALLFVLPLGGRCMELDLTTPAPPRAVPQLSSGALLDAPPMKLDCAAAMLLEAESGQILFEFNADSQRAVASVTKLMTILLTLEAIDSGRLALEQLQAAKSKTPIPLTRAMFEKAFEKIPPSISAKVLKEYEEFR